MQPTIAKQELESVLAALEQSAPFVSSLTAGMGDAHGYHTEMLKMVNAYNRALRWLRSEAYRIAAQQPTPFDQA